MKKVVLKEQEKRIYLSDITDDNIIGVKWKHDESKALIYCQDKLYMFLSNYNITKNRCPVRKTSIQELIKKCEHDIKNVYVFETEKELFKWMSE